MKGKKLSQDIYLKLGHRISNFYSLKTMFFCFVFSHCEFYTCEIHVQIAYFPIEHCVEETY